MENEYDLQAENFAQKFGVKLSFIGDPQYKKHFIGDESERWVFKCKLTRGGKSYTFDFGQSINAGSQPPRMYDVLTCLEKYDPENFDNFCGNYGYDTDSRIAEKIYKAVCKEYAAVERLFSDCLDELRETQ